MSRKSRKYLKKAIKIFLMLLAGMALLFILLAVLIQLPAIQSRIVHRITKVVSDKTATTVHIDKARIAFPKTVVVQGIFLDDLQQDTLLSAGIIRVNIALRELLYKRININSIKIEDVSLKLNRNPTDSLFNYNFLIAALTDTSAPPPEPSPWSFLIKRVNLENIHVQYNDGHSRTDISLALRQLRLVMNGFDPGGADHSIKRLVIDGLQGDIIMAQGERSAGKSVNRLSAQTNLDHFELTNGEVNLKNKTVSLEKFFMANSEFHYTERAGKDTLYSFDPGNIAISLKKFAASDLYYYSEKAGGTINSFSATDGNGFTVEQLKGIFRFDHQSFAADKLQLETTHSAIAANLQVQYPSVQMMLDSIESASFTLDLQKLELRNSDILYFVPQLNKQPVFANPENRTSISGNFSGSPDDIAIADLHIGTGKQTVLSADLTLTGLPQTDSLIVRLPGLSLSSGRKDIRMLAGDLVPEEITLPERFNMQLAFNGMMDDFDAEAELQSSFGDLQLFAALRPDKSFSGKLNSEEFNLGLLMNDTVLFGPVTVTAEVTGSGLERSSLNARVDADVSKLFLNSYTYHGLNIDGTFSDQVLEGMVGLEDENLVFGFDGLVNLKPGKEKYQFRLDLQGANLQGLNFSKDDIRIGLVAEADVYGPVNDLHGRVDLSGINAVREEELYVLDSLSAVFSNVPGCSELQFNSNFLKADYKGTIPPTAVIDELKQFIRGYSSLARKGEAAQPDDKDEYGEERALGDSLSAPSDFSFSMQLRNHPILSEVSLPGLTSFEPFEAKVQFDSESGLLELDARMKHLVYGAMEINDFTVFANSDSSVVHYAISAKSVATEQVELANLMFEGNIGEHGIITNFTSLDDDFGKKLAFNTHLARVGDSYWLTIDPESLFLMYNRWEVDAGNQILFGLDGLMIDRLFMRNDEREVKIASVNQQFNDDLSINIRNFRLEDLSQIIETDSGLVKGTVDGSVLLTKALPGDKGYSVTGIIADASVSNLIVLGVPIGNLTVATTNPAENRYDLSATLSGAGNDLTATGHIIRSTTRGTIDLTADIASLSMKTAEALSGGQITETAGTLSGNAYISGPLSTPKVTGQLNFSEVYFKPAALNNRLKIANETVHLKSDGLYFDSFKITDSNKQSASITGSVKMQAFKDITLALQLKADDFLLMNTTIRDNETVFGRMVIGSDISIHGPLSLPVVRGRLKLKEGSHATFVVPESQLSTDRGENVVLFDSPPGLNPILEEGTTTAISRSGFNGIDLSTILEIDRQATLRLLLDPSSTDSLVVQGETAMSLAMDRSGKVSLTGIYTIFEGSYLVSLESVIKRRFTIVQGSSITWKGDPLDATLSLDARYKVRTSPYDLVAAQMSGLSDAEKGAYKQQVPFWVILKLRGDMMQPQINFEIELPPEEKGALGGALNQKLVLLNQDASALNKQVFSLLVLGRFMQENPLHTETGSTAGIVRSNVGSFLSAHLNRLGADVLQGTELNVDIQSYEEYQTEKPQGRTEVEVGIRKQLFNERLSVQVGRTIDVEGERAMQNRASDITGDVRIEYKLTEDGWLRLKGFRQNRYKGALEGQIIETGAGVSFVRDFNEWIELFRSQDKKKEQQ
ncbi:MAG: translocation/assembly module TamB domain-containing protein [Bacteroidales bacterium]|nr:translocation/assembly module TamB domain-containing protein [Bacteroidales bacterium]